MNTTTNKTVLITGATAGIGRHAALHLSRRGHRVIATGRKLEELERLRAESDSRIEIVKLDVNDATSIAEAARIVDGIVGAHGLDVLINNAGFGLAAPLAEMSDADVRAQFDTNVFGLMAVTRAFLPGMQSRGRGRIVNVSSIGGRFVFPMFGAYNATKFAVEALSDALRRELAGFGIRVVLVEPGPILSNFADRSMTGVTRYRSETSPYAGIYARADKLRALTDANSYGPEHTSRALQRAVESRRPSARYIAPGRLAAMVWMLNVLPTRMIDWLVGRASGLDARSLARGRSTAAPALAATTTV